MIVCIAMIGVSQAINTCTKPSCLYLDAYSGHIIAGASTLKLPENGGTVFLGPTSLSKHLCTEPDTKQVLLEQTPFERWFEPLVRMAKQ